MKKLILITILTTMIVPLTFGFSEESRADMKRAESWWGDREDELYMRLVELRGQNPDPSDPKDKTWQEYLKVSSEIQQAVEKQELYRKTALFNYNRSIMQDTVQVYKPVGDFMEGVYGRGVELVSSLISANWQGLVKLAVDSVLRTRLKAKIRSTLDCRDSVKGLEDWLIIIGFGEDPWANTIEGALLNWARSERDGNAMKLSLQLEKSRQIYSDFLKSPKKVSVWESLGKSPVQWLEDTTAKSAEEILKVLGMATFITDLGTRLWISFEMDDSINDTLANMKVLRDKYAENDEELSCEDTFLVWSKQKSITITDPEEQKRIDDLKLGLEFFLKKIPRWYNNKTVPDHFDEILRMIPIAEELGEYTTAKNLRDILVEFEYKVMTDEEIKESERQSLIEETKKNLISNLKILRNYLNNKNYEEVENQWDRVQSLWKELIELEYDTDNDPEIQNLWREVRPLLQNLPEIDTNDSPKQDVLIDASNNPLAQIKSESEIFISYMKGNKFNRAKSSYIKLMVPMDEVLSLMESNGLSVQDQGLAKAVLNSIENTFKDKNMDEESLEPYDSFVGNTLGNDYKNNIIQLANSLLAAVQSGNENLQSSIEEQWEAQISSGKNLGIYYDDIGKDAKTSAILEDIFERIDNILYDEEDEFETDDSDSGTYDDSGLGTSNSGF